MFSKDFKIMVLAFMLVFLGAYSFILQNKQLKESNIKIKLHKIQEIRLSEIKTHHGGRGSPNYRTASILYILDDKIISYKEQNITDSFFNISVDFMSMSDKDKKMHKVALLEFDDGTICQFKNMIKNGSVDDYKKEIDQYINTGKILKDFCLKGNIKRI